MRTMIGVCLVATSLLAGCDESGDALDVTLRSEADNGPALNGAQLNGRSLNGWSLNGRSLNGRSLNGWSLNGRSLNGRSLNGTLFAGTQVIAGQTVTLAGTQLIGSQLTFEGGGFTDTLRFDDIFLDPADPDGDVYFYAISVLDSTTGTWSSLCHDLDGAPTEAIPLTNHWNMDTGARIDDPDAVTFACRSAALGKCVVWGYRPWASVNDCVNGVCTTVALADHHQACTRMARADYCGTGTPNTLNNTPIDIYDRLALQIQAPATTKEDKEWKVEAEWGPDGALCLTKERRLTLFKDLHLVHPDPPCRAALEKIKECGKFLPARAAQAKLGNNYCDRWSSEPDKCEL